VGDPLTAARVLVVEDDDVIGAALESTLRQNGYQALWVRTGRSAVRAATAEEFDLVLLDLGLPDLDGVEVCRQLRSAQSSSVVVMLTARQDEMDVVVGLEAGADDYLTKPFRSTELLARIRAHLRRGPTMSALSDTLLTGDLQIDTAARRCTLHGTAIPLRTKEFDLLARLASEPGVAVSREALMADVWDAHWTGSTKTLDVHVATLRRRLATAAEQNPGSRPPTIVTLRGFGYRLDDPAGR
jgi:DNA-binding response OmpR family regulator